MEQRNNLVLQDVYKRQLRRHAEGVVCFGAAHPGKAEAGAELDALDLSLIHI